LKPYHFSCLFALLVIGVKPFKCDQCDYSTVERSHLKVHIRVHTGYSFKYCLCQLAAVCHSMAKTSNSLLQLLSWRLVVW